MQNLWILNHYAGTSGGRHYKFAKNLTEDGYNVKVFRASTFHKRNENKITDGRQYLYELHNGVPYVFIKTRDYVGNGKDRVKNMFDYAWGLLSVTKEFDTKKPDIIYASSVHPLTWLAGYILAKRYNAKFIAETRDLWPETLVAMGRIKRNSIPAKLLYTLERFIYKKADALIFTFPGGKDYVNNIGLDTTKVRYINNGVDSTEFVDNKQKYIVEDTDLDNENTFKVLYTGSMGQANALNYLLEAAKITNEKGFKDIRFILYGDGYQKEELVNYARDNNISNVVFKGRVEKKYIPNVLSKGNLNIFTGKHIYLYKYGLSLNKLFEYFASGKPIVSNMECGYNLLEKYKCGFTVPGGSAETLSEGILKFYHMPQREYESYGQNALIAARDFDFKTLTRKLEKILGEI